MAKASLRRKLIILILTAIGCAQALVVGVTLWQETSRYAKTKKDALLADAHVLAAAVSKPTAARDQATIFAALRAIGAIPDLKYVGVQDASGQVVAELGAAEILSSDLVIDENEAPIPLDRLFMTRSIVSRIPIVNAGTRAGSLVLISDARDLRERLLNTLRISGIALLGSILIALIIAWRMQRAITQPIENLTATMQSVAAKHDYDASLNSSGSIREVNILIDGFNTMLGEIRDRDDRIARSYADLERQVAERTVDLSLARDAAESASAQKSDFLATMSHEIRTPMNGMLVMAELLAHAELPSRLHRYAEVVWRSGQGLLAIINDILDFSKIEAGKLELERVPVNLAELASTVIDLFGEKARLKKLDLSSMIAIDVPHTVEGDPVRLNQVLSNLVNNALKFTERGGVLLDVAREQGSNDRIRFSVIDTGIGIAEDKIGSVFGAFSQAEQSTTRRYGGTGLGLAICRRLVQAMGAEIHVASKRGEGSIFSFVVALPTVEKAPLWRSLNDADFRYLGVSLAGPFTAQSIGYYFSQAGYQVETISPEMPLGSLRGGGVIVVDASRRLRTEFEQARKNGYRVVSLVDRDAESPDNVVADAVLSWPASRRDIEELLAALSDQRERRVVQMAPACSGHDRFDGVHALVADDNEINREVANEALKKLGIAVDLAEDGAAAVRAAATTAYDVIFMDGSMPVLDGVAATRLIRTGEQERGQNPTAIVALTAHVVGTSHTDWMDAGVNATLGKPFTLAALTKCLNEVLPDRGAAAAFTRSDALADLRRTDDLIDETTIGELRRLADGGRTDFVTRVVRLYLDHAPRAAVDIADQARAGQFETLAKSAHALKSMSLNIGAKLVTSLASTIEVNAKGSKHPDHATLLALTSAIEHTCAYLAEIGAPARESDTLAAISAH